jgi:hypothetical protein
MYSLQLLWQAVAPLGMAQSQFQQDDLVNLDASVASH